MAAVINYKGDPFDLLESHSGLINYLFGKTRKKQINKEQLLKFQEDLMNDILWLEFTRYSNNNHAITDLDFCNHILLCANITSKKKKQMVRYSLVIENTKRYNVLFLNILYIHHFYISATIFHSRWIEA